VKTEPVHVGLTGGIGSGKSTVANMLCNLGAIVIDADAISKEITGVNGVALQDIVSVFGQHLISPIGGLDRDKMREIVFHDPSARIRLEAILHPLIHKEMQARAYHAAFMETACIVFDVPKLVESGTWRGTVAQVLVIDCSTETQQARVMARSGLEKTMVQRILAAQATRQERLNAADIVLFNDGISLAQLTLLVQSIASKIGL
jgi:dephospho-CoA kinase